MTVVVVVLIENYRCKFSFCTSLGPGSAMAEKGKKRGRMWPIHRCYFIFFSFFTRTSASSRAKRARRARKKNKELFSIFFFPHHYPLALAVNKSPAVYITALAHLRLTLRPPWLVPLLFARPTKPLCYAGYDTKLIDLEGLENRQASSAALWGTRVANRAPQRA